MILSSKITAAIDDHVFIIIEREGRPTISLDLMNNHGRASLGIRSDGNGIANVLCDVGSLKPKSGAMNRFCPMCGIKIDHSQSFDHECKANEYE